MNCACFSGRLFQRGDGCIGGKGGGEQGPDLRLAEGFSRSASRYFELSGTERLDLRCNAHVPVGDEKLAEPASILALFKVGEELSSHQLGRGLAGILLRLVGRPSDRAARAVPARGD